jgi:site-specific DNA recombinase
LLPVISAGTEVPHCFDRAIGRTSNPVRHDRALIKALRRAHAMVINERSGLPRIDASPGSPYLRRLLRLAFLAPDLQADIFAGRQPATLSLEQAMTTDLALDWQQQRQQLGWLPTGCSN